MKVVTFESQELFAGGAKDIYKVSFSLSQGSRSARPIRVEKSGISCLELNRDSAKELIAALTYILGDQK